MEFLPRPRTAFFGRARSLAGIRQRLEEERLMTLTGVGGAGKTRLALRVAEEAVPELAEDVGWVELASVADARLVPQAVCSAVGMGLAADTSALEELVKRLKSGRWLIVLDNCEHLTDACADLAATLLDQCPELRILATSREALGVSGESVWPVGPLAVTDVHEVAGAMECASVQLLADRARKVQPDFKVTPENVKAVVELCRNLEGIPLALELAAARTKMLSLDQILKRLDEGLSLLGTSDHEVDSRHRTMRAALKWSHDLLTEAERVLFRRLAAFGCDADIDACEAVCPGGMVDPGEILDLLTSLCEKSLVVVNESGNVARYRLLEPVRQFALEQLEASGERNEVCRRHAAHYLELAQSLAPALQAADRADAIRRLEAEHDNLRNAWNHAAATGDAQTVEGLAGAQFWFWQFGGHFTEGRMRAEEALAKLESSESSLLSVLHASGALAWNQGDYDVAAKRLARCADLCEQEGNFGLCGIALRELAGVHMAVGELTDAAAVYECSTDLLQQTERRWDLALAMLMSADVRELLDEPEAAELTRRKARALFGKVKDPWGLSLVYFSMGVAAAKAGDLDQARIHAREALALQRDDADYWNIGQFQALLGEIEIGAGNPVGAATHFRESIRAFREVGDRMSLVYVIHCLAACERRRGRTLRAIRLAAAASGHGEWLEGDYFYAVMGQAEHAQTIEDLQRVSGKEAFAEEWASGRSLGFEDLVDLALTDPTEPAIDTRDADVAPGTALRVFALGPTRAYRGTRRLRRSDWSFALPRELLFYFLVKGPRTKEQIGLDFWPEASETQLRGRFRTAVYQLRRALGGTEWILYRNSRYEFNRSLDYWFDIEAFEHSLDEAMRVIDNDAPAAADMLQRAIDLYQGDFLEGESSREWAHEHREQLSRRFFDALLTLGGLHAARDAHAAAADIYRQAMRYDLLSERACRALARALAAQGDRAEALHCLDHLAELLGQELDVQPSTETLALKAELQGHRIP